MTFSSRYGWSHSQNVCPACERSRRWFTYRRVVLNAPFASNLNGTDLVPDIGMTPLIDLHPWPAGLLVDECAGCGAVLS